MSISRKNRIKDIVACWIYGLEILIILWIISSTFEVWYHNALWYQGITYTYSPYNFYDIILNL